MRIVAPLASALLLLWAWTAHAQIAVTRVAASTSTGNQDLTAPGVTWTPRAALLFTTYAVTDATAAAGALLAIGMTDCTNQRALLFRSGDNVATTETAVWGATTALVQVLNEGNTALDGAGAFVACIAGGVRINWTDALSQGYLVHLVLFGPQTVSQAFVGHVNTNSTLDASVDVTAPGFQPHDVVLLAIRANLTDTLATPNRGCLGVGNATAQGGMGWADANAAGATTNIVGGLGATYACNTAVDSAWPNISLELHSFDTQGFSLATRRVGGGFPAVYLALRYQPGVSSWAGVFATPTTPTTATATAPGFAPDFVLLLQTGAATLETEEDDADAGYYGVSLLTASAQYNLSWADQDGVDIANAQSLSDNQAINLPAGAGTALFTGTLSSLAAPGFALNFSATDTTARQWYGWAISGSASGLRRRGLSWW